MRLDYKRILSTVNAENFVGRIQELEAISAHAEAENEMKGLLFSAAPALGASEVLRQTFDRMFDENEKTIPFYFALKKSDKTAKQCAVRFLQMFLSQIVAFRRDDDELLASSPDICELAQISLPSDGNWIDRLIENCENDSRLNDERAFVRHCLSAPLRAKAHGTEVFVMIDDLHEAESFGGESDFIEELKDIFSRANVRFVFAGHRRFLFESFHGNYETLELAPLSFKEAGFLIEKLAENLNVAINEQTRDLITMQFGANPLFINLLFRAASEKEKNLDSFQRVEQIYTDELFGGRFGRFYDRIFSEIAPKAEIQKSFTGLLYDAVTLDKEKSAIESWQKRSELGAEDFYRAMCYLNQNEIIRITTNLVEAVTENQVLNDYIKSRFRLETIEENRALVVGEMLSDFLKRAPQIMAKFYRRNSAIGLRELLSVFDCQETPLALLDYAEFKDKFKGAEDEEIQTNLEKQSSKIILPQIVYTAHTVAFYPPLKQFTEQERSAVALGFEESRYTNEGEIVWLAAEIDSKLEANREVTEFWCDRLEMVALMCNFPKNQIWLVAPEGFSDDAMEILRSRNAFGSSKKQLQFLINYLKAEDTIGKKMPMNEYEMIVPMGEDTEMIAAQTVEEIARRHHFAPKAINQIKTALVEACINATEHSLSPDRKIYQKFAVEDDKIVITISNRGLRLADKQAQEITPDEGRRGWGLNLMKNLMDEVKVEQVDDGTRISMTKYLK